MANFSAGRYADRPHRIGIKHLARVVAVHITQRNDILIGAGPDVLLGDSADTDAGYIQSVIGAENPAGKDGQRGPRGRRYFHEMSTGNVTCTHIYCASETAFLGC